MNFNQFIANLKAGGKVACFGSRETPQHVLDLMQRIGRLIASNGGVCASGHCSGADWNYEQGACSTAPERMLVCLPWATYNRRAEDHMPIHPKAKVIVFDNLPQDEKLVIRRIAEKHHGAWNRLTNGARLLHSRNILIGVGAFMGFTYLNHSKPGGGGSGQCYRYMTEEEKVGVVDFSKPKVVEGWDSLLTGIGM
jgi:hypothetical protein